MQTPEEFARSALDDGRVSIWEHQADEIAALADLIRARDAEVRDAERAKVLAGFEWEERGELGACTHPHHVHDVTGVAAWSSSECHHKFEADARRLVGPWEPTP